MLKDITTVLPNVPFYSGCVCQNDGHKFTAYVSALVKSTASTLYDIFYWIDSMLAFRRLPRGWGKQCFYNVIGHGANLQ